VHPLSKCVEFYGGCVVAINNFSGVCIIVSLNTFESTVDSMDCAIVVLSMYLQAWIQVSALGLDKKTKRLWKEVGGEAHHKKDG
jgi:hypothetical protein